MQKGCLPKGNAMKKLGFVLTVLSLFASWVVMPSISSAAVVTANPATTRSMYGTPYGLGLSGSITTSSPDSYWHNTIYRCYNFTPSRDYSVPNDPDQVGAGTFPVLWGGWPIGYFTATAVYQFKLTCQGHNSQSSGSNPYSVDWGASSDIVYYPYSP